jgi:arylsulfatase
MIVTGPDVLARDVIEGQYVTVMDLAPTFLEIAGANYPADGSVRPMLGASMLAFLKGESDRVHDDNYTTVLSHWGRALVRRGDWKMSTLEPPFDESKFELFNIAEDPGETRNLRQSEPEKYGELLDAWRQRRREYGIVLPQDL